MSNGAKLSIVAVLYESRVLSANGCHKRGNWCSSVHGPPLQPGSDPSSTAQPVPAPSPRTSIGPRAGSSVAMSNGVTVVTTSGIGGTVQATISKIANASRASRFAMIRTIRQPASW